MLATCQLPASFCYHAEFQEVCYQKQENGRFVARSRHGMCESGFNMAGERHGMCESALKVLSTEQEMTPARNTIGTHAQDLVVDQVFLLRTLKTFVVSLLTVGNSKCLIFFLFVC